MRDDATRHKLAFWLILLVGAGVRLFHFGTVPDGLNIDEASVGVEAYSLLHYGVNRWNNAFPVYFPAWGSGLQPLYVYLTLPMVKLLGLTVYAVRMVNMTVGIATLPLAYWVARLAFGRAAALLGMGLLAILPWHVMMSRWGLDSNLLPACVLLGLGSLMAGLRDDAPPSLRWVALLPWALAIYAYTVALLALPLFFVLVLAVYRREIGRHWRGWCVAAAAGSAAALPMFLFLVKNYLVKGPLPFEHALPFSLPLFASSRLAQTGFLAGKWVAAKNALFAVSMFHDSLPANASQFFLPLSPVIPPLALIGLAWSAVTPDLRRRAMPLILCLVAWAPLFLLVELNINRANVVMLLAILFAAQGAVSVWRGLGPARLRQVAAICGAAFIAVFSLLFVQYYFTSYRDEIGAPFDPGIERAFAAAFAASSPAEPIYVVAEDVREGMLEPYIYPLFFQPQAIADFHRDVDYHVADGAYVVSSFGRFAFAPDAKPLHNAASYVYVAAAGRTACPGAEAIFSSAAWAVGRCREPHAPVTAALGSNSAPR